MKVSAPHTGDCQLCDKPLGSVKVRKVKRGWVHLACWMSEKGE